MRIKQLILKNYGPFKNYSISFIEEDEVCLLLTGKNNEGKSSIINALKLLDAATRVIHKQKQDIIIDGDDYSELFKQDTEHILIGRMIYNYKATKAEIIGIFKDDFKITVFLDSIENKIYAEARGRIPADVGSIFGFIPPLGPLNESENIITELTYLKASMNTSLAPRHLRNHFYQILTADEFDLVKELIKISWLGIELLKYEVIAAENKIYCYYKEGNIDREISWAGQGLQVWFQIITHAVRLRNTSILVLDEPEINLHPEKQNDLIRILKDYYHGSIIVATHSVELMNNVNVSHIINVQKKHNEPRMKSTEDRTNLDLIRSQIGSNFNLIASQFEEFDHILFTEDAFDFDLLLKLSEGFKIQSKVFNIPIHGFSEYNKCIPYKAAYRILIGKEIRCTLVLDRDYYPDEYLNKIVAQLKKHDIKVVFTPGKEIENLFLTPKLVSNLIPAKLLEKYNALNDTLFSSSRMDSFGSYLKLHADFISPRIDMKTITKKYGPKFEKMWANPKNRHRIIPGKDGLKLLRRFYKNETIDNLSTQLLTEKLLASKDVDTKQFIDEIFRVKA
jgi:energy-coupling factor transporter ATP-binding protein EcfA2